MTKVKSRSFLLLALTLVALFLIVSMFPYEYRDSDSPATAHLPKAGLEPSGRGARRNGGATAGNEGLFREHPPGILWLPALLVRRGSSPTWPPSARISFTCSSLFFVFKLAERWGIPSSAGGPSSASS